MKNAGGWNDDWQLSHHIVREAGIEAAFEEMVSHFQGLFLGNGSGEDGLMLRERWVAKPGVLEKLNEQFGFAVFTGRPKVEADMTLRRFAPGLVFAPVIGMEDVDNHKPAPEGLLKILEANRDCRGLLRR